MLEIIEYEIGEYETIEEFIEDSNVEIKDKFKKIEEKVKNSPEKYWGRSLLNKLLCSLDDEYKIIWKAKSFKIYKVFKNDYCKTTKSGL